MPEQPQEKPEPSTPIEKEGDKSAFSRHPGQYFNYPALRSTMGALIFNRAYFEPHIRVRELHAIDFARLKELGIRHIVFDKDNTLTFPYERGYMNQ